MSTWLERFDGYRVTVSERRINDWLTKFRPEDSDLAARVLDAVSFLRSEHMEHALRETVSRLPGWHRSKKERKGKWRFVAFSTSAGESGDTMLHKLRTALGLTRGQYNELFIHKADLLRQRLEPNDTVAFVDDFAGTGQQGCNHWRELAELLPGSPKSYLILVAAAQKAIDRICQETGLNMVAQYLLQPNDDIFSEECDHFTKQEKDRLLEYCRRADRKNPRGFGNCGFVIVLAHKTPNNSIPVLHANHPGWRGLFPRT
ncbi:MAG: hypothetical protein ACHQRJ_22035 [Alphaproteobacteria bacterium]